MSGKRMLFELIQQRPFLFQPAAAIFAKPAQHHQASKKYRLVAALFTHGSFKEKTPSTRASRWFSISPWREQLHATPDVVIRLSHSEAATAPCWFCSEVLQSASLICTNCGYIQQVREDMNHFQEDFDVDLGKLQKLLQKLQLMVHPDKHSTKGDDVRQLAEQQSSRLNKAFTALKSPLQRARHLLEVKGAPIQEDARLEDTKFLMQVMELREEVAEAVSEEEVRALLAQNEQRRQQWQGKLLQAFGAGLLDEAQRLVFEMAYWDRIEEQLKEKL